MRRCGWCLVLVLIEHVGGRGRNKGKKTKNFSSPVTCPGEEEEETVPSKTTPFHLNGNWRQSVSDFKSVL